MPAVFRDRRGEEAIEFQSTGRALSTSIRGVSFSGSNFSSLTPEVETDQFDLINGDSLCGCSFSVKIPVRLITPHGLRIVQIESDIILGLPTERGGLDIEDICVRLSQPEFSITSPGKSGWFEDELLYLVSQLPSGFSLKMCFTCGLSDYSPYGHGSFGSMACFRDSAAEYRLVHSKAGIFQIWHQSTEYVQETYYCEQYESRIKGQGYRG